MKTIAIVSVARSDYGIYRPLLQAMTAEPELNPVVVAGAAHLEVKFGLTVQEFEKDGFEVGATVAMTPQEDDRLSMGLAMAQGVAGFSAVFSEMKPDMVMVLGDRYETFAAAAATVPLRVPLVHLHGGEVSYGAIDEVFRHAITKMSHLHFASTVGHANRLRQMGEEDWRITVSGAPALDAISKYKPLSRAEFGVKFGLVLPEKDYLVVTFHPATASDIAPLDQCRAFFDPLAASGLPALITMPNADAGSGAIRRYVLGLVAKNPQWVVVESLGVEGYYTALSYAAGMAGNSSSGIIEAASFGLPVLNVGERQRGRMHEANVLSVEAKESEVAAGLKELLSEKQKALSKATVNPYGDGKASERIVQKLVETPVNQRLLVKEFVDR